jgi:two-component system sensor kinase FixL
MIQGGHCWRESCLGDPPAGLIATIVEEPFLTEDESVVSTTVSDPETRPPAPLAQSLGRSLRHELGDFLQKVYASVAILEARLPATWQIEREVLSRLRQRAEGCRVFLDTVQDYLCPLTLNARTVDLAEVAQQLSQDAGQKFPGIQIQSESVQPVWITADPERINQVGEALLTNACEAARSQVTFATTADSAGGTVQWVIDDDGPGLSSDSSASLFRPFSSTRPGHAGLGLVLVQKLVMMHGGRITLTNRPDGGCSARVSLPMGGVPVPAYSPEAETAT